MKINKSESHNIEFKQAWRDEYLKWICAFANTDGGTLYIGVTDKGEVCGVEDSHKLTEDIPNKIRNTMGLICDVKLLQDGEKDYFEIKVEKYPFPVSYHGKYYKRTGSTIQELSGVELDKMILFVQGRTWDSIPVPHIDINDLDNDSFRMFKNYALEHERMDEESLAVSNETLLRNLRMYENQYLTRAAVMCFHPDPEKWVTGAYIKIAYFETDSQIRFQDEVHGSLIRQVDRSLELIYTKYMKALIDYPDEIHRSETFFFPRAAFRELLLNAVIHRDYMRPTPIQIKIYRDKIRIWNIGELPKEVPVESLFSEHSSVQRNPNIANVFFKGGYIESWGRGYKNITDECNERHAKLPEPEENSGGVAVYCYASDRYIELAKKYKVDGFAGNEGLNAPDNFPKTSQRLPKDIPEVAQRTYEVIAENPKATLKELAEKLGLSDRTIKTHISHLKDAGLIERVGGKTHGYWRVIK